MSFLFFCAFFVETFQLCWGKELRTRIARASKNKEEQTMKKMMVRAPVVFLFYVFAGICYLVLLAYGAITLQLPAFVLIALNLVIKYAPFGFRERFFIFDSALSLGVLLVWAHAIVNDVNLYKVLFS